MGLGIVATGAIVLAGAAWAEEAPAESPGIPGHVAPEVISAYPGRFFRDVTDVGSVKVEFHLPVVGIKAADLTVNGSSAAQVTGSGSGPYTFSGYTVPAEGSVTIALAAGEITRDGGTGRFAGYSWDVRFFKADSDADGDGLANGKEIEAFSDPSKPDSDDDGLPDPFELSHGCLKPFINEAAEHNEYGTIVPGDDDADDDGVSNADEFRRGTDPCAAEAGPAGQT